MVLELLNLVFAVANAIGAFSLYSDASVPFPTTGESVLAIQASRERFREDGKGTCYYTGVLVPFALTPPDGAAAAATPDGHALLFNEKVCQNKPTEAVLVGGFIPSRNLMMQWPQGGVVHVNPLAELPVDQRAGLAQALLRMEAAAPKNPIAAKFLQTPGLPRVP